MTFQFMSSFKIYTTITHTHLIRSKLISLNLKHANQDIIKRKTRTLN